jgi:hypothetical protein
MKAQRLGERAARHLAELRCCEIAPGLTDAEFDRVEARYGFEFADDHRAFLAVGLPVRQPRKPGQTWSSPWPDWRNGDPDALRRQLDWPVQGVLNEIEGGSWHEGWGPRPDNGDAVVVARQRLAEVPRMVPIYGHRCLPAGRGTFGHPVLSMWGTDIICYGENLADYIHRDFKKPPPEYPKRWRTEVTVPFWREYVE